MQQTQYLFLLQGFNTMMCVQVIGSDLKIEDSQAEVRCEKSPVGIPFCFFDKKNTTEMSFIQIEGHIVFA